MGCQKQPEGGFQNLLGEKSILVSPPNTK